VPASDKLFYWLFQEEPDRILQLLPDLQADASGYQFTAPVLKERECRLDGLFRPKAERPDLPTLILEAQMAADAGFLRRLYAESALLLQQESAIQHWRVVVLCPRRQLAFGDPTAVAEFVRERVQWLELLPALNDANAPALLQALALLLQSEDKLPASSAAIRARVAGTAQEGAIRDVIAAILITRFRTRLIPEICAMGGLTLDDFTQSVAYKQIFEQGELQGRQEGRQEGRQQEACALLCRQLERRFGSLPAELKARLQVLPLATLEALSEALLEFQCLGDLQSWLAMQGTGG
jgi:predicted transposase YdaD